MSTQKLEHILRNPPAVKPPADLLADLQRQMVLPKSVTSRATLPFWKQWMPALSFGVLVLGCIVALGVQTSELIQLKRENRTLQEQVATKGVTSEPQTTFATAPGLSAAEQEEIVNLRAEVEQLRQQLQLADQLRAEQEQLRQQLLAAKERLRDEDPFAAYKEKAESIACANNLKQIGLAARLWAHEHNWQLPPDLVSMRKELNTPKILVCPADRARTAALTWEEWTPAQVTYEYLGAENSEKDWEAVVTRCPIHGNVGVNDGSAHMNRKLMMENGRLKLFHAKP